MGGTHLFVAFANNSNRIHARARRLQSVMLMHQSMPDGAIGQRLWLVYHQ